MKLADTRTLVVVHLLATGMALRLASRVTARFGRPGSGYRGEACQRLFVTAIGSTFGLTAAVAHKRTTSSQAVHVTGVGAPSATRGVSPKAEVGERAPANMRAISSRRSGSQCERTQIMQHRVDYR